MVRVNFIKTCVLVKFHSFRPELHDASPIFSKEGEGGKGSVCPVGQSKEEKDLESLCEKSEALGLTSKRDEHHPEKMEEEELQVKAR